MQELHDDVSDRYDRHEHRWDLQGGEYVGEVGGYRGEAGEVGEVGEYFGEVGDICAGDVGEYRGDAGLNDGLVGE